LAESKSRVFFAWGSDDGDVTPRQQVPPPQHIAEEMYNPPAAAVAAVAAPPQHQHQHQHQHQPNAQVPHAAPPAPHQIPNRAARKQPKKPKKKTKAATAKRAWGAPPPSKRNKSKKAAAATDSQKKRPFAMYGRNVDTAGRGNRKTFNVKAATEIKRGALRAGVRAGGISIKRAEKAAHLPSVAVALPAVEPVTPPATDEDFSPAVAHPQAAATVAAAAARPPRQAPARAAHVAQPVAVASRFPDALSDAQRAELLRIVDSEIARHVELWHLDGGGGDGGGNGGGMPSEHVEHHQQHHFEANNGGPSPMPQAPVPAPAPAPAPAPESHLGYSSDDGVSEDEELHDAVHNSGGPPPPPQQQQQQQHVPYYQPNTEWLTEYQANFISPPAAFASPKRRAASARHFTAANKPGGPHVLWIPHASARSVDGENVGKAWK